MSQQGQAKPGKTLLITAYHKMKSDRILQGTEDGPNKVYLNMPEKMFISNTSFVTEKGKRRTTRWYMGCQTIYLDDQLKYERENQLEARKIEKKDSIAIIGGFLEVADTDASHTLHEFISRHNDNTSNPDRVAPPEGEDLCAFVVLDYEKDAEDAINKIDQRTMAFDLLNKCRTGIGATRKYDDAQLGKLRAIFGLQTITPAEIYKALYDTADTDPEKFISKIDQAKFLVLHNFEAAKKAEAISYEDGKFSINGAVVFTTTEKDAKKIDAEFIDFLSTEAGWPAFTEMCSQTMINQNSPK